MEVRSNITEWIDLSIGGTDQTSWIDQKIFVTSSQLREG